MTRQSLHTTGRKRPRTGGLTPRVKVWLECGNEYAFGLGLCEILQAVEHTGSIKHAAGEIGKSYRHVWSRIKEAEAAFGLRLIETHVGGTGRRRSFLTAQAQLLVEQFRDWRRTVMEFAQRDYARRAAQGAPAAMRRRSRTPD